MADAQKLEHLLGIEDLEVSSIRRLLDRGKKFKSDLEKGKKKFIHLRERTVVNLFFEPSSRTRSSFEMAEKRLDADNINFMADSSTSVVKGETLIDTAKILEAMSPDFLVLRHGSAGAPQLLSKKLEIPVINAGDGFHEHPSQALLDALTIETTKGSIEGLKVAIIGDIAHSRVARSNIYLLNKMGATVTVCGPPTLLPPHVGRLKVRETYSVQEAIEDADVVMILRIQFERQNTKQIPSNAEYYRLYGLNNNTARQLKGGAIIMHPGPMNRGVEISPQVADGSNSVILNQVTNGVAIRMAILACLEEDRNRGRV